MRVNLSKFKYNKLKNVKINYKKIDKKHHQGHSTFYKHIYHKIFPTCSN